MRTHQQFLEQRDTSVPELNARLEAFLAEYLRYRRASARSLHLLDVGCGSKALLAQHRVAGDVYHACDYAQRIGVEVDHYWSLDLNTTSVAETAPEGARYDVIFCGEVIEHLFSPDALLRDLHVLLQPSGILILSTPNLGYYVNRLLLLVGISPLYLENSAERKLGRKTRLLGQGNPTEGHIRLFTYGAARDLFAREGFAIERVVPTIIWDFPPDRLICRLSRSLAPNNVFVLSHRGAGSIRYG
jgi:predicted SAM-dependent methyltransferase